MLKEYIKNDIEKFINTNEFADDISINGVVVKAIIDNDKLLYRIKRDFDGLVVGDVLFYISETELAKIPALNKNPFKSNQAINYKGIPSTITSVSEQDGIYEVIIQYGG